MNIPVQELLWDRSLTICVYDPYGPYVRVMCGPKYTPTYKRFSSCASEYGHRPLTRFWANSLFSTLMTPTSSEQRWAIVAKWKETQSIAAAAKSQGVSYNVANRWIGRYQSTGAVDDSARPGRPLILDEAASEKALDLLLSNEEGGAKAVGVKLHTTGYSSNAADRVTVARAARRAAEARGVKIKVLRGKPRKRVTEATRKKRLEFCKKHLKTNWSSTLFTDRKKFHFTYPGQKVLPVTWTTSGGVREATAVNHAQVVNVYAGISKSGMTRFRIVAGTSGHKTNYQTLKGKGAKNITNMEYSDVVKTMFLPEGRRIFSTQGVSNWVLQQDNDPTHRAAYSVVKEWNAQHASSIEVLRGWPPNSPDLNPIENFWGYLQGKMEAKGCSTFQEFKSELENVAKAVPTSYFKKLVLSMPKRMAKCVALEGGKTGY